jgi:hypothetical protein
MGEDRLAMSQRERDRLKVLHEANKGQITQKQAAEQLKLSERHIPCILKKLGSMGDRAVIRGPSSEVGCSRGTFKHLQWPQMNHSWPSASLGNEKGPGSSQNNADERQSDEPSELAVLVEAVPTSRLATA